MAFLELSFVIFNLKVWIIYEKCHYFFYENEHFTLPFPSSSSIYNIIIAINTPTTMNNQFEDLNAPKNQFSLFISNILFTKTISLSISLFIHPKKPQDFYSKFCKAHRAIQTPDSWPLTSGPFSC